MTTRTDIDITYTTSPRVVEVRAPSVEMTMQDWVDTLRKQEDTFQGMSYKRLVDASGKEDLGGGVSVGITIASQDSLLAFAGRTTAAESGTVATVPAPPAPSVQVFTDGSALFETNNVARGSLVVNFSDGSVADVVSVDSETQLTTKVLIEGSINDYTIGDTYKVWNIIQCKASGGNLTAVDSAGSTISGVLPTAFTQILITASSSATTQNQESLNFAVYQGHVHIESGSGFSGTAFPKGTEEEPVDNLADALLILAATGLSKLRVIGDWTFGATDVLDNLTIGGQGPSLSELVFTSGASTDRSIIHDATISGDLTGALDLRTVHLENITGVGSTATETNIHGCLFEDTGGITMTLNAAATQKVHISGSESGNATNEPVEVDWNSALCDGTIRAWKGGLKLLNLDGNQSVSFDSTGGHLTIDSTCTNCNITIRGNTKYTDNSAGGATITDETTAAINWERLAENGLTFEDVVSVLLAGIAGKADGANTTTMHFRNQADTKNRITATVDEFGNRTSITIDLTN